MRTEGAGRATIRDVAERAGVSPGTVSKALRGTGQVSRATRDAVHAAATALDFRLPPRAEDAFEGRSYTVGVISTDSFGRFGVPVMLGAEDALGAGQVSVVLCDTRDDPIRERHYVDLLVSRRVDGFIVTGRSSNPRPPLVGAGRVPVVYALTPSQDPADCSVVVDDHRAGAVAAEHLLLGGRSRIAHITGPEYFDAARARAQGLADTLAGAGLDRTGPVYHGEWTEEWGRQAGQLLLRAHPQVDAVHCGSDLIARGVLDALRDGGRAVPEDVAVTGTDNWEILAAGSRPPLTTVDTGLTRVGRIAAQRLLDAIDGRAHHGVEQVAGELVVRGSSV